MIKGWVMKTKTASTILLTVVVILITAALAGIQGAAAAADAKGGGPARDYMTYLKALDKRDGAAIRKMADVPPGTSDKELKEQMDMMAAMTPSDQEIVSVTVDKDTAVLKVTGKLEGQKQYGTVRMRENGGRWKITNEEWSETQKK